jgi:hypothetical protein
MHLQPHLAIMKVVLDTFALINESLHLLGSAQEARRPVSRG